MRRTRIAAIIAVVVALFVAGTAYWLHSDHTAGKPADTAEVGPAGGNYQFGALRLHVPSGAVGKTAKLEIRKLEKPRSALPLGTLQAAAPAVFDVSLDGGRTQPHKPLTLEVNLAAGLLPVGIRPAQVIAYTATPDGNAYRPLPGSLNGSTLRLTLDHLSEKVLTYLDGDKLAGQMARELQLSGDHYKVRPSGCATQVQLAGTGKIKLGTAKGWSHKSGSPVHPCLTVRNGKLLLRVLNNSSPTWQIAASNGTSVHAPKGDIDEEAIKLLARQLWPPKATKGYLFRHKGTLVVIPSAALPAEVQLRADPGPFLAEATWLAFNMASDVFGLTDHSRNLKLLLDSKSAIDCIRSATNASDAMAKKDFASVFSGMFGVFTSICGGKIAEAIGHYANDPLAWAKFWKNVPAVIGDVVNGAGTAWAGLEGAFRQLGGTVKVTIGAETPCITARQFSSMYEAPDGTLPIVEQVVCRQGWAFVRANFVFWHMHVGHVLRYKNSAWEDVYNNEGAGMPLSQCAQLPLAIKSQVYCE